MKEMDRPPEIRPVPASRNSALTRFLMRFAYVPGRRESVKAVSLMAGAVAISACAPDVINASERILIDDALARAVSPEGHQEKKALYWDLPGKRPVRIRFDSDDSLRLARDMGILKGKIRGEIMVCSKQEVESYVGEEIKFIREDMTNLQPRLEVRVTSALNNDQAAAFTLDWPAGQSVRAFIWDQNRQVEVPGMAGFMQTGRWHEPTVLQNYFNTQRTLALSQSNNQQP